MSVERLLPRQKARFRHGLLAKPNHQIYYSIFPAQSTTLEANTIFLLIERPNIHLGHQAADLPIARSYTSRTLPPSSIKPERILIKKMTPPRAKSPNASSGFVLSRKKMASFFKKSIAPPARRAFPTLAFAPALQSRRIVG